ncbi:MAG: cupin domain-containing protein [Alphaproteobacteria bacterium]|nr:MAG: cupin domain-containing protein [Alphaproteobacteria bacterium]
MAKIDIEAVPERVGSGYPAPFDEPCRERRSRALGLAGGLTQFGVNLVTLPPGAWSSQRHWHAREDEFVQVLEGEVVLVTDEGEAILKAGECAAFPAGTRNGHHFRNRSGRNAVLLAVGTRDDADWGEYPDIDLIYRPGRYSGRGGVFAHKDGTPYGEAAGGKDEE